MQTTRTASRMMGLVSQTYNRANGSFSSDGTAKNSQSATKMDGLQLHPENSRQIKILSSLDDVVHFETQWRKLEDACAKPTNIFQSYDWCKNWIKQCVSAENYCDIHIVTIIVDGQCKLIWPMMATCQGPFCTLRWLSEPWSQYGDVLVEQGPQKNELLDMAWQALKNHPTADSIRLRHVREDANIHEFLAEHALADGQTDYAPYLEIEKFPTEEAYNTRYTKSQRRRRKRIRKNMEQFGPVNFTRVFKGDAYNHTLKQALNEKRKWLAEKGLHSKPVSSDHLLPFFASIAKTGKDLQTVASMITAGEREISYEIGFRYRGYHFGYITAHDAELTHASPARMHMDWSQRTAIKDGMKAFDLMVPADPHKVTWSSAKVKTTDYFTHINFTGTIYTFWYLTLLRPLVRLIYLKAPDKIRRFITKFV